MIFISSAIRVPGLTMVALLCVAPVASANVTISSAATTNIACADGVCAPTAEDAVLNVGDLETLLASGDVEVTTTGAGVQATDIQLDSTLTWANSAMLTLDAYRSIAVDSAVSVTGQGGLTLTTNDGGKKGELSFADGGDVAFADLASQLTIDGNNYALVGSISQLAGGIASSPNGYFALANAYDASGDGTYSASPIPTAFEGTFEGLGNLVTNLSIRSKSRHLGLFAEIDGALLSNVEIMNVRIDGAANHVQEIGALVGINQKGIIKTSSSSGSLAGHKLGAIGGLVGESQGGQIIRSASAASVSGTRISGGLLGLDKGTLVKWCGAMGNVSADDRGAAGGLIGENISDSSTIIQSFALGSVTSKKGSAGGLVGVNGGRISDSYATGTATGTFIVGGFAGGNNGSIARSYSTGTVTADANYAGGFLGYDNSDAGDIVDSYWDTSTSGITDPSRGAGNIANDPGIVGLSTQHFQSGLPKGFSSKVWQENAEINDGLPYLTNNPPR